MNLVEHTQKTAKPSSLRQAQTDLTRKRIREAAASLLGADGDQQAITFKAVAALAGMTEMTVYRHFPNRSALLKAVWEHLNARMGEGIGMPENLAALRAQHEAMFAGFDRIAPQIIAAIATPEGREMRSALNDERQAAFEAIASEAAPGLDAASRRRIAALLQLLHSAHAWLSLREQWSMTGSEAAETTRWLIELILKEAKGAQR